MKKLVSLMVIFSLITSIVFASNGDAIVKKQTQVSLGADSDGYYYEQEEYEFDKLLSEFDADEIEIANRLISDKTDLDGSKIIYKMVKKDFYVETDKTSGKERILTNSAQDKETIKKLKKYRISENRDVFARFTKKVSRNAVGAYVGAKSLTYKNVTLSLTVYKLVEAGKVGYCAVGGAGYKQMYGILTPADSKPSTGDDCAAFSWGGGFDFKNDYCDRLYKSEAGNLSYNLGTGVNLLTNNVARGWSFKEYIPIMSSYYFLNNLNAQIDIYKPSFSGGTTKLIWTYCHTYSTNSYGFSLQYPSPSISVTPTSSQWQNLVYVTINQ